MKLILGIVLLALIALFPLFHPGTYLSHDGEAHVARFAAYYSAFQDGQFPPRWAGTLNSGYGSSIFIFFYPLPGYIASLIHVFGLSFESIFKFMIVVSFLLSPLFLFLWLKKTGKTEAAFMTAIAYLFLPYRFLDSLVRGDIAELVSFIFVPLVFLFIDKSLKEKKTQTILLGGVFYALLILAHNAMAVVFSPVFLAYIFVFAKKRSDVLATLGIFVVGICLSAFFWLPAILETKYVYVNLLVTTIYKQNFVSLPHLIYSPWGFGPDLNIVGGLSPQIGIVYVSIVVFAFLSLWKIKQRKAIIFWLSVFFVSAFMSTEYSSLLWGKLPVINLMGYPWRFTALSGFAACMLFFYVIQFVNKKFYPLFLLIIFVFSIPFMQVKSYVPKKTDNFYFSYQGTTDYHMRATTKWVAGDFGQKAKSQIEIISGEGNVTNLVKKSNLHTFETNATTALQIVDNTAYFPGWIVTVDGTQVPVEFQDQHHRGLMSFPVPSGRHEVNVKFTESKIREISDIISLMSILVLIIFFGRTLLYNKKVFRS